MQLHLNSETSYIFYDCLLKCPVRAYTFLWGRGLSPPSCCHSFLTLHKFRYLFHSRLNWKKYNVPQVSSSLVCVCLWLWLWMLVLSPPSMWLLTNNYRCSPRLKPSKSYLLQMVIVLWKYRFSWGKTAPKHSLSSPCS